MSPQVGLEPTTCRLTADRSTTELLKIFYYMINILYNIILKIKTFIFLSALSKHSLPGGSTPSILIPLPQGGLGVGPPGREHLKYGLKKLSFFRDPI
jgi:hypothetical protein